MSKGKFLAFSAAVAAGIVAVVLCGKQTGGEVKKGVEPSVGAMPSTGGTQAACSVAQATPAVTNQTPTARGTLPYVLTSVAPLDKTLRQAAEALGAKTVSVLSRNALLVEAAPAVRTRLSADRRFKSVSEFAPSSKVQPALAAAISGGATSVDVAIISLAAADRAFVIARLEAGGGEVLKGCFNEGGTVRAKLPAELVSELAQCGEVRWMESFERPQLMNNVAVEPAAMNVREVWNTHGLTGAGQIVSTSDSGIDTGDTSTMHKDLCNQVMAIKVVEGANAKDLNGHGTHTAGSIVGDGSQSWGQIRGTAYGAKLCAWFCGGQGNYVLKPSSARALYTANGEWDAHIHSASWGTRLAGAYNADCVEHDGFLWENPEFLPVFSAGNEGSGKCTIGTPGSAKNVLTVGATQNLRSGGDGGYGNGDPTKTAYYSSRGPCKDGRTKPDVAAPGSGVLSTRAQGINYSYGNYDANYAYCTGTSMACPLTAGAVALVRQWLVERKGFADEDGKRPTAALMKAVVMGGAKDAPVPNNNQGWGRVDLEETLFPSDGRGVLLVDRIPFDSGFVTNIIVETTNDAPFDVQLVWVDYPGSAEGDQTASKLVNDLDLTVSVRQPGEPTIRYGNGGTEPDALNNAEVVRIARAVPSKYVITVSCKHIQHDYTEGGAAALYIRGAFDPEAKVEPPAYVHLKKQNTDFMTLDAALAAVNEPGETVEILDWVNLDNPVTLTQDLTIIATNADASAAYVERRDGALLTVAPGATVTLSNVVFAAATESLAEVRDGGCLRLGPKVELGVDVDHVAITAEGATGFDLAGELTEKLLFRCEAATGVGEAFGTYSCEQTVAEGCAEKIICADDVEHELRGAVGVDGTLLWRTVPVPIEEAAAYFVDDTGATNAYRRMERAVAQFKQCYESGKTSAFVIRQDGPLDLPFEVRTPLTIQGEGLVRPVMDVAGTAGFEVFADGSLVLSNLVFRGCAMSAGRSFVAVEGGELTLAQDVVLDGFIGYRDAGSGVIDAVTGVVNVQGATIVNCSAMGDTTGKGLGGAIYVDCEPSCTLNLKGVTIANCYASAYGGGVYVYNYPGYAPTVNLSGALNIAENSSGNNVESDNVCLYMAGETAGFRLAGDAEGTVGVWYETHRMGTATGNAEGDVFMANSASASGAEIFFCDVDGDLKGSDGADGTLVWSWQPDDGQCAPEEAKVLRIDAEGNTNYYATVEKAFAFMDENASYAVELLSTVLLDETVTVSAGCDVTLRSAVGALRALGRNGDFGFVVPAGTALALTNVYVTGYGDYWSDARSVPFFDVPGGRLELQSDATVCDVFGWGNRAAGAITVYRGGTFVMRDGAWIDYCTNAYFDDANYRVDYSVGAGLLVDGTDDAGTPSVAYLLGGKVSDCLAVCGGAVCVCNGAEVHVAGGFSVEIDKPDYYNVFVVEDLSNLLIDEPLTGVFNMANGVLGPFSDTNYVGRVTWDWENDVVALTNSAARFFHSVLHVRGVAVTNTEEAIVVWRTAIQNGVYTNANGVGYFAAGDLGPQYIVVPHTPVPFAFQAIAVDETTCTLTLDDLVKDARYLLFKTNSLAGGFAIEGVEPFTNFTAEADGPCELKFERDPAPQFWRALGVETYTTNYFNK